MFNGLFNLEMKKKWNKILGETCLMIWNDSKNFLFSIFRNQIQTRKWSKNYPIERHWCMLQWISINSKKKENCTKSSSSFSFKLHRKTCNIIIFRWSKLVDTFVNETNLENFTWLHNNNNRYWHFLFQFLSKNCFVKGDICSK